MLKAEILFVVVYQFIVIYPSIVQLMSVDSILTNWSRIGPADPLT